MTSISSSRRSDIDHTV